MVLFKTKDSVLFNMVKCIHILGNGSNIQEVKIIIAKNGTRDSATFSQMIIA